MRSARLLTLAAIAVLVAGCADSHAPKGLSDVQRIAAVEPCTADTATCARSFATIAKVIRAECGKDLESRQIFFAVEHDQNPARFQQTVSEMKALCPDKVPPLP